MSKSQFQAPRGTKDIFGEDQNFWKYLYDIVTEKMAVFGAKRIETPIFEFGEIFLRAIGKGTDIVDKEMFEVHRASRMTESQLEAEDTKMMVLRPEYTAGIMRSYIQNGMDNLPQPVKLWYWGPAFRYERPQAGRYRIHNQFGLEVIGDNDPLTDTAVIFLAWQIIKKLNLTSFIAIDINSVGDDECRTKMKKKLVEYFQNFLPALCSDCNRRFIENPLRIFDCKEDKCQKIIAGAPQLVDMLCNDCKSHFKNVLESLDILQIPYNLNPCLVRGLDYYTKTVFEIYLSNDKSRQRTLIGGGRYDGLATLLGGSSTPAIGWTGGVERFIEIIKDKGIKLPEEKLTDICLVQLGEKARKNALLIAAELEEAGFKATAIIGKQSLKSQLRSASKMGAQICLIIGQREVIDKSVILKDMEQGLQETISQKKLVDILKSRLSKTRRA